MERRDVAPDVLLWCVAEETQLGLEERQMGLLCREDALDEVLGRRVMRSSRRLPRPVQTGASQPLYLHVVLEHLAQRCPDVGRLERELRLTAEIDEEPTR